MNSRGNRHSNKTLHGVDEQSADATAGAMVLTVAIFFGTVHIYYYHVYDR